ncbi:putative xyloglucan glycosyltransferase 12 [Camellia lanceoleosa]|nr:putative xyloglucan glycosyltransferase 12 [Camellia lanceoleosa]
MLQVETKPATRMPNRAEIAAYFKGWHFRSSNLQFQYLYVLANQLNVKGLFDSLYSNWVLIRVECLAPSLQFLTGDSWRTTVLLSLSPAKLAKLYYLSVSLSEPSRSVNAVVAIAIAIAKLRLKFCLNHCEALVHRDLSTQSSIWTIAISQHRCRHREALSEPSRSRRRSV